MGRSRWAGKGTVQVHEPGPAARRGGEAMTARRQATNAGAGGWGPSADEVRIIRAARFLSRR